MVNLQQWLDQKYPKQQRSEIKVLAADIISEENLENCQMDLSDFVSLEVIVYSGSELESTNFLTTLVNPEKINHLHLWLLSNESDERYDREIFYILKNH